MSNKLGNYKYTDVKQIGEFDFEQQIATNSHDVNKNINFNKNKHLIQISMI